MENKFNNRDFEQFVKQNADQYRMFPSEKVWRGIHNSLHTRRKWFGIGLGLLLLTTGAVTWVMLTPASGGKQPYSAISTNIKSIKLPEKANQNPALISAQTKPANDKVAFITSSDRFQKNLFTIEAVNQLNDVNTANNIADVLQEPELNYPEPVILSAVLPQPELISKPVVAVHNKQVVSAIKTAENYISPGQVKNNIDLSAVKDNSDKNAEITSGKETTLPKNDIYPFTIESIVNSYRHIRQRKKISWQIYFTPTVSYRKLNENKGFLNASRPYTASSNSNTFTDVNSVVTHKPDVGLQFGFTAGYPLSKKIRITGGLQFNISKYDILAFSYPSEVATIALSTSTGGTNTVSTFTNYRNSGGSSNANWLRNLYISASAPIGIEYKLAGNKKSYVGIGTTIQPTYTLSNRAYLISTDYKNYVEVPSLVRKWNVNTGFEIFAGYSTGKLNWRFSPQVRYQTLSSFQGKYPVKEHLFDFGVKLGLMLK